MKEIIKSAEQVYIDSSKSLEILFKNKSLYNDDELNWLKEEFRWIKNESKSFLKNMLEDKENYDSGLNYPFYYNYLK